MLLSKRLRDLLTDPKRKKTVYNRDTHRVMLAADIHACNHCGGWETKSDTWREETPILHEPWCRLYPSLANIELEHSLEESKRWIGSKWDSRSPDYQRVKAACAAQGHTG